MPELKQGAKTKRTFGISIDKPIIDMMKWSKGDYINVTPKVKEGTEDTKTRRWIVLEKL